jgi:lysophospholipase L1-like esterase
LGSFRSTRIPAGLLVAVSTSATLVLMAGAGEGALRYRERHRTTVPGTMPLMYYRHAYLGYALVHDMDYFGWVHINRQGFRGPDVTLEKSAGVTRIMAVGGSTTFDSYVTGDDRAWPARLAVHLAEQLPGRRLEVINAGVPGYRIQADVFRLETSLTRYRPDIIILYQGHNDLFNALRAARATMAPPSNTPFEMPTETPWGHWLSRHSLLYAKILDRWNAVQFLRSGTRQRQAAVAEQRPPLELGPALDQFRWELTSFILLAQEAGIQVVLPEPVQVSGVGTQSEPDSARRLRWETAVPFASTEEVLEGFRQYSQVLREVGNRFGARFIPTDQFGLAGTEWYSDGDPIHFNDRGADRMARAMATSLVAAGLFKTAIRSNGPGLGLRGQ